MCVLQGGGETQLKLSEGDFVEMLEEPNEDGWAWGRLIDGRSSGEGYYPVGYTEPRAGGGGGGGLDASDDGYVTCRYHLSMQVLSPRCCEVSLHCVTCLIEFFTLGVETYGARS